MTEDNALAGPAFPRPLAALGALGLLLVALQLPTPARQTVARPPWMSQYRARDQGQEVT